MTFMFVMSVIMTVVAVFLTIGSCFWGEEWADDE